jgi:hypothetical protein
VEASRPEHQRAEASDEQLIPHDRFRINERLCEAVSRPSSINRISVIVPMLNEAAYVEQLVRDPVGQDFAGEVR